LVVILNARQIEAVDFFVLPKQGIVRRAEQGIPEYAKVSADAQETAVAMRGDTVQGKGGSRRGDRNESRERDQRNQERERQRLADFQASRCGSPHHCNPRIIASVGTLPELWKTSILPEELQL
jgi:hypothetical protein